MPEAFTDQTPYTLLLDFEEEEATWQGLPHCPDTVTMRNMIRLADWVANHPVEWRVVRDRALMPHMTQTELAALLDISQQHVSRILSETMKIETYPKNED